MNPFSFQCGIFLKDISLIMIIVNISALEASSKGKNCVGRPVGMATSVYMECSTVMPG